MRSPAMPAASVVPRPRWPYLAARSLALAHSQRWDGASSRAWCV